MEVERRAEAWEETPRTAQAHALEAVLDRYLHCLSTEVGGLTCGDPRTILMDPLGRLAGLNPDTVEMITARASARAVV